jgi:hypothetical protein
VADQDNLLGRLVSARKKHSPQRRTNAQDVGRLGATRSARSSSMRCACSQVARRTDEPVIQLRRFNDVFNIPEEGGPWCLVWVFKCKHQSIGVLNQRLVSTPATLNTTVLALTKLEREHLHGGEADSDANAEAAVFLQILQP